MTLREEDINELRNELGIETTEDNMEIKHYTIMICLKSVLAFRYIHVTLYPTLKFYIYWIYLRILNIYLRIRWIFLKKNKSEFSVSYKFLLALSWEFLAVLLNICTNTYYFFHYVKYIFSPITSSYFYISWKQFLLAHF